MKMVWNLYSFWMLIMDIGYNKGKWKHVFHKEMIVVIQIEHQVYGYILLKQFRNLYEYF